MEGLKSYEEEQEEESEDELYKRPAVGEGEAAADPWWSLWLKGWPLLCWLKRMSWL